MGLDGFKLKHLKMLVALNEHRKLGVVAEMFGLSQPALSRTLSELEQMSGHRLFDRHNRGLTPTPQGEVIVRHARMVLADTQRAEYEMAAAARGQGGNVAFGTITTSAADYVAPALNRIFEEDPTLDVSIVVGSSDVLLDDVINRRLDFAICRIPPGMNPIRFDYVPLGAETLRLVVAADHPLAQKSFVNEDDLARQNWVLQPHGSFLRQVVDEFIRNHAIVPANVISTASSLLTILLLMQSSRVGIFAKPVADLLEAHGLIRALPIAADITMPDFGIVTLRERALSTQAEMMIDAFRRGVEHESQDVRAGENVF
jgi:DNA-binding transcriptional LysR family regulator